VVGDGAAGWFIRTTHLLQSLVAERLSGECAETLAPREGKADPGVRISDALEIGL
jgi:hypothetical protein